MKTFKAILFACALTLAAGDFVWAAPAAAQPPFVIDLMSGMSAISATVQSASATVQLAWPEEGERRKWFASQETGLLLARVQTLCRFEGEKENHLLSSFVALHLSPRTAIKAGRKVPVGRGKQAWSFVLKGPAVPWELTLDLGRSVPARWIQMKPGPGKFQKEQRLNLTMREQQLGLSISDAVLRHYPPMSLKQKKASLVLVEQAAKDLGAKK
jgi:hypothetical protein